MIIELTNGREIEVGIICKSLGKDINIEKLSAHDILTILQEITDEFIEFQQNIESLLDEKYGGNKVAYNGEYKTWEAHLNPRMGY